MIRPKIPLVQNGQRLTSDLINSMIHRTEYAADLLRQYRLTAGTEMYVEPHYDGTRVSYFYPVGGGTTIVQPISEFIVPNKQYTIPSDLTDEELAKLDFKFPPYTFIPNSGYTLSIYGGYWLFFNSPPGQGVGEGYAAIFGQQNPVPLSLPIEYITPPGFPQQYIKSILPYNPSIGYWQGGGFILSKN